MVYWQERVNLGDIKMAKQYIKISFLIALSGILLSNPIFSQTLTPAPAPSTTPLVPDDRYWYLPAGATRIGEYDFDEIITVINSTFDDAYIELTALDEMGPIIRKSEVIHPQSTKIFELASLVKGTRGENNDSVSVIIYNLARGITMVDRSMYWDAGGIDWGGGHNSVGSNTRAIKWALPEGATHVFDEYIHILNPDDDYPANVLVTFMNQDGTNWTVQSTINPETNWTVYVNDIVGSQPHISTLVESQPSWGNGVQLKWPPEGRVPVIAERTMYWDGIGYDGNTVKWIGGHCSRGTSEQSTIWYLSEGATHFADMYVLVVNPSTVQDADIRITLMNMDGVLEVVNKVVPPISRYTCYVNRVIGWDEPHVSAIVESLPRPAPAEDPHDATYIMCERVMYWKPFDNERWGAGHGTIGVSAGAPIWYLPGTSMWELDQFILLANPDETRTAEAEVTFYFENDPPMWTILTVGPQSRRSFYINRLISAPVVGTRIEETTEPFEDKIPIIAERTMYWHSYNPWVQWVAGHNTIGIPVRMEEK
jgi:hypothetical protein